MNSVFVFSGTTEGREISHFLCENKIKNSVFVATEYGEAVMPDEEYATVHIGRLDVDDMARLFSDEQPELIIDATHPYATEVTKNIRTAADLAKMSERYLRVSRNLSGEFGYEKVAKVASTEKAIDFLKAHTKGNVLLTTGVKELGSFVEDEALRSRVYARILPGKESLTKAFELDVMPRQIIAMEGPFSVEMNVALIKQFDIKVLVTKNGGAKGGFKEKLKACQICDIEAVVIEPDGQDDGLSFDNAIEFIKNRFNLHNTRVTVVGTGMGTMDSITVESLETIKAADVLIGAKRMVDFGKSYNPKARTYIEYKKEEIKKIIDTECGKIAILVSGDTGFFSLAQGMTEVCEEVKLLPGVSAISYLAAKAKVSYSNARILSFHGNDVSDTELRLSDDKVFCIFSGKEDLARCIGMNKDYKAYIGYNLGQETEKLLTEADSIELDGLYTACFTRDK